jgi:hypothetical protein
MLFLINSLDIVCIYEVGIMFVPFFEGDGGLSERHQVSIIKEFGTSRRTHEQLPQLNLKILFLELAFLVNLVKNPYS